MVEQRGHGYDVHRVVVENAAYGAGVTAAQIIEIDLWNQPAGDIFSGALKAQNFNLQITQTAIRQPVAPQPAGQRQQVEMSQVRQRRLQSMERIACVEQRRVERFAVEGDQRPARLQEFGQRVKLGAFLGGIAHKELGQVKGVARKTARADEKGIRAGSAGQTRCFGIEKDKLVQVAPGQALIGPIGDTAERRFQAQANLPVPVAVGVGRFG